MYYFNAYVVCAVCACVWMDLYTNVYVLIDCVYI